MQTNPVDVAVVGAGIAGLSAARQLVEAGLDVVVLERARGVGGRAATRRVENRPVDHGAQYVTAREPAFEQVIRGMATTGRATAWAGELRTLDPEGSRPEREPADATIRWVFPEGVAALGRQLAVGLDVRPSQQVEAVTGMQGAPGWRLHPATGSAVEARAVVLAVPAPQAAALARQAPGGRELAELADLAEYEPCWTLLAGYGWRPSPPWRAVSAHDDAVLGMVSNDTSRRGGAGELVLVIQANGTWSNAHLEDDPETVRTALLAAAARVAGTWARQPVWSQVHRWRYARVTRTATTPFLLSEAGPGPLGMCGDWCTGPRVESAWQSGRLLGTELRHRLAH